MTEQEIKDSKPDDVTCYKLMNCGRPLYFNNSHQYWNWVSEKWIDTCVRYYEDNIKPL